MSERTQPKGRVFQPKGRNVWMLAYYGPRGGRTVEIRESAKTRNEKEARALLAKKLREVANDREGLVRFIAPVGKAKRAQVFELLDDLLADRKHRDAKGCRQDENRVKVGSPLREALGAVAADKLTAKMVADYAEARRRGTPTDDGELRRLANATVNREIELLGAALRLGLERERIRWIPALPKKLPERNARQGFLETADFEKIVARLPQPLPDLARFGFVTGWRRSELLGLKWEWIDLRAGEIRIPDSKNGEGRVIPIDGPLTEIVERMGAARPFAGSSGPGISAFVFHRRGKPVYPTVLAKQWTKAARAAGLPGKLFHDLRRTAVRNMIRSGTPETVAMKISGHKTRAMLDRYNITDGRDMAKALRASHEYASQKGPESAAVVSIGGRTQRAENTDTLPREAQ